MLWMPDSKMVLRLCRICWKPVPPPRKLPLSWKTLVGVERVAHGQLSEALGIAPTVTVRIRRLSDVASPAALTEPVESAINRALQQRPDLLAQLAQVRAAEAGIKGARSEYFPTVSFSGNVDYQFNHGY